MVTRGRVPTQRTVARRPDTLINPRRRALRELPFERERQLAPVSARA